MKKSPKFKLLCGQAKSGCACVSVEFFFCLFIFSCWKFILKLLIGITMWWKMWCEKINKEISQSAVFLSVAQRLSRLLWFQRTSSLLDRTRRKKVIVDLGLCTWQNLFVYISEIVCLHFGSCLFTFFLFTFRASRVTWGNFVFFLEKGEVSEQTPTE